MRDVRGNTSGIKKAAICCANVPCIIGLCLFVLSLGPAHFAWARAVDNETLSDINTTDWPAYGKNFNEQRYSTLKQVNDRNVQRLGLAWSLELPGIDNAVTQPLAVDGVLYFAASYSIVHAVDARTGKLLWRYDAEVPKHAGSKLRLAWGSRGIAFWQGKVYVGTQDGRLIAVDAKTGESVWSVLTVEKDDVRYITGAPRVFNGKVIIGHGGADFGPVRGYVTAYDAETGRQVWRFYTVPGDPAKGFENKAMEMAAKTWTGELWKQGGGGTVWNAMTYDPEYNRVYLGTGNGAPRNYKARSPDGGDNLFLCSVLALDADTGDYVWHYQTNPGESWDYNSAMDIILATIEIEGRPRKVIMHAPKNGFFYVIDRKSGKLISAEKIGKATWAERIDLATGRPVENPQARYPNGEALVWPGQIGVHSWQPMSFNPDTQLVYIPTMELPGFFSDKGIDTRHWKPLVTSVPYPYFALNMPVSKSPPKDAGKSYLLAWDPLRQHAAWKHTTPGLWNGGTITTAGNLVFQGQVDGLFKAYAADTGAELWSFNAGNGIVAPPLTFSHQGKQYVAVLTGVAGGAGLYGSITAQFGWMARVHPRRLLVFALDARTKLPPTPPPQMAQPIDEPGFVPEPDLVVRASQAYAPRCSGCHGPGAVAAGTAPDLRASPVSLSPEAFEQIVRGGLLEARGMPKFAELNDEEVEMIRYFIRVRAKEDARAPDAGNAQSGADGHAGGH